MGAFCLDKSMLDCFETDFFPRGGALAIPLTDFGGESAEPLFFERLSVGYWQLIVRLWHR